MCVCYIFWYHLYWSLFLLIKSETGLYQEGSYLTFSDFKALSVGRQGAEESMWSAWLLWLCITEWQGQLSSTKKRPVQPELNYIRGWQSSKHPPEAKVRGFVLPSTRMSFYYPVSRTTPLTLLPLKGAKRREGRVVISGILSFRKILPC